ncbi:MAG TPA: pseudouridine synthase [Candidatus Limnocylindria bacterium]|nr:pseudouridine synthase [Candidatus Limnocylindria bacterium]
MAGRAIRSREARIAEIAGRCGAVIDGRSGGVCGKVEGGGLKKVGLARALSKLGYCSRSSAAELIVAGRVKWNGAVRRDPETPVHIGKDRIEIDGQPLANSSKIYLTLNKPRGVVTTAADEKGRETVYAYLPKDLPWIAPVGRLDKASEGLLLLTNNSEWAARITAPETHLDKTYHVQISAIGDEKLLRALRSEIHTNDGEFLRVKNVRVLPQGERHSWLEIVLDEGKNRHIRRMLEELKIGVLRLVRVAIGPLILGDLPKGATRPLEQEEKQALDRAMRTPNRVPASSVR